MLFGENAWMDCKDKNSPTVETLERLTRAKDCGIFCVAGRSQMLYFSLFSKAAIIARVNSVSSKITFFSTTDCHCHF